MALKGTKKGSLAEMESLRAEVDSNHEEIGELKRENQQLLRQVFDLKIKSIGLLERRCQF